MNKTVISLLFLLSSSTMLYSQSGGLPRAYPLEMETLLYYGTYLKITYTQTPVLKDKPESGDLWEIGSNEPAELITTGDIMVGTDTLKAGAYSMFAIPGDSTWTIIFNGDVGLFGTYRYNENADSLRVEATLSPTDKFYENLEVSFTRKGVPDSELAIYLRKLQVSVPIRILNPEDDH